MSRVLHWRSLANLAWQLAVLALLLAAFFMRTPQVTGLSMAPHIASGEYVLINTFAYRMAAPKRGDIVAFRHDGDNGGVFIKRVVGLPGERVAVRSGVVYVNGAKLDEPYVRYPDERSFPEVLVPANTVYVLGDNRAESEDSRLFGTVPDDRLVGRALAGVWPPQTLGIL